MNILNENKIDPQKWLINRSVPWKSVSRCSRQILSNQRLKVICRRWNTIRFTVIIGGFSLYCYLRLFLQQIRVGSSWMQLFTTIIRFIATWIESNVELWLGQSWFIQPWSPVLWMENWLAGWISTEINCWLNSKSMMNLHFLSVLYSSSPFQPF